MSIVKNLPDVHPFFMQECPLCHRKNRMVVKGVYRYAGKTEIHPDIGYSFCNCRAIFYTNLDNVKNPDEFTGYRNPIHLLSCYFSQMKPGETRTIVMPDPFFCEWQQDPYSFPHWNPRVHHIIWDMHSFCEAAREVGFKIASSERNMEVGSENPQTMKIVLEHP